jgi:serine/threonine protein kinase
VDAFDLEFKEVVGKGSFGTVYRAVLRRPKGFRKEVAVKVLHDRWVADRVITARLRDEARVLGLLRHRALPSAEGLFWVADRPALVTEFVEGVTLTQLRARKPLPVTVALELCAEVANALHVAWHTPGPDGRPLHLVHRDIKPSNLQVTAAGEVKLLDFGIARADFDEREAETHNHLVGSLSYMSPERLDFVHGPEGDVYSLGVVLAEVLLGRRPDRTSADRTRHEAFLASLGEQLAALHGTSSAVGVVELVRELLAYEAGHRPTAREVERRCRDLRRTLAGPDLAEWAEKAVADARTSRAPIEEPTSVALLGTTLPARPPEDTGSPAPRREASPVEAAAPAPEPPRASEATPAPPEPEASVGSDPGLPFAAGSSVVARSEEPAVRVEAPRPPAAPRGAAVWLGVLGLLGVALVGALGVLGGVVAGVGGLADGDAPAPAPPSQPEPVPVAIPSEPEPVDPPPAPATPPPALPSAPAPTASEPRPGAAPAPRPDPAPAPAPSAPAPAPRPAPTVPKPAAPSSAGAAGAPVSAASFGSFVGAHAEWTHDEAIARKRAGDAYLQGWSGLTPPAGATHVTHVSFFAAQAYCASRGGLPPVDAPPTTWAEGTGPFQEWRVTAEGAAAWRRFDGVVSTAVRRTDANGFTGFRCAR